MELKIGQILRHIQITTLIVRVHRIGPRLIEVEWIKPKDLSKAAPWKTFSKLKTARIYRSWVIDEVATVLYGDK